MQFLYLNTEQKFGGTNANKHSITDENNLRKILSES